MEKIVRILSGFNQQAEVPLLANESVSLGSDGECAIILADAGVHGVHCELRFDLNKPDSVLCTAVGADLVCADRTLTPGEAAYIKDYQVIQCGSISIAMGDAQHDWSALTPQASTASAPSPTWSHAPTPQRKYKRSHYLTMGLLGLLCSIGLVYAALPPMAEISSKSYMESAERWLKGIAPAGSELKLSRTAVADSPNQLLLSGYVATSYQSELLSMAARESAFHPKVEVYAVDQMVASLARLANLENLPCIANYRSAGQLGCSNEMSEFHADRLRALAQQIPGVKALQLSVRADATPPSSKEGNPPAASASTVTPEPVAAMAPPPLPPFNRKLNVFMSKKVRYVVDSRGMKFSEGDVIDGYTITSIALDQIQMQYGEQKLTLQMGFPQ